MLKKMMVLCVTIVMILLISSTARGESWVLWTKTEYIQSNLQSNVFWEIINAFPDHNQCLQAKKKVWQVQHNQAMEDKKKNETIDEIKEVANEIIVTNFKDPKDIHSVSQEIATSFLASYPKCYTD
jgi:hypothetical protein